MARLKRYISPWLPSRSERFSDDPAPPTGSVPRVASFMAGTPDLLTLHEGGVVPPVNARERARGRKLARLFQSAARPGVRHLTGTPRGRARRAFRGGSERTRRRGARAGAGPDAAPRGRRRGAPGRPAATW